MESTRVMSFLRSLCSDIDAGRRPRPFEWRRTVGAFAVPLAIGIASVASGCASEDCHDGVDNDGDRKVDCSDPECSDLCGVNAEYAAPFPMDVEPPAVSEYGAPFPRDPAPPVAAYGSPFPEVVDPPKPPVGFDSDHSSPVPAYGVPHVQEPSGLDGRPPAPVQRYRAPLPEGVRRYGAPFSDG
jgi:hypothetical protein